MAKQINWEILDSGKGSAKQNMEMDATLLENLDPNGSAILHFYEWEKDAATYGYFVQPEKFLDLEGVRKKGLDLAKRPTGGGIVFHLWDFAFSVLLPLNHPHFSQNTLENYLYINQKVLFTLREYLSETLSLIPNNVSPCDSTCIHFCMAQPTKYDVTIEGKKIAGASQRRTKKGFLHQGSISLLPPLEEYLQEVLQKGTPVLRSIQEHTFALFRQSENLEEEKKKLKQALIRNFIEK